MRINKEKRIENNMGELIRADAEVMDNVERLRMEFEEFDWFKQLKHSTEWLDEIVWMLATTINNG